MIVIHNISPEGTPLDGTNTYEVLINEKLIATFEHKRKVGGLAGCLRDAAYAVERADHNRLLKFLEVTVCIPNNS